MTKDVASSPALRDGLLPAMSVALSEKPSPVSVPRPTPIALESLENNKRTINDIISAGSPVVASNWVVELPRSIKSIKTNRNPAPSNVKTSSSPALHTDLTAQTPPVGSTGSQVVTSHEFAIRSCLTPITSQVAVSPLPPSTDGTLFCSLPLFLSTSSTNSPVCKKTVMSLVRNPAPSNVKTSSSPALHTDITARTPPVGSTGSQVVASHGIAVRPCPTPITSQAAVSPSPPSTNAIPFRSLPLIPSTSSTNSPVYKKTIMSLVAQAAKAASEAAAAAALAAQASQSCSKLATQASFGLCQDKTPFFPV